MQEKKDNLNLKVRQYICVMTDKIDLTGLIVKKSAQKKL